MMFTLSPTCLALVLTFAKDFKDMLKEKFALFKRYISRIRCCRKRRKSSIASNKMQLGETPSSTCTHQEEMISISAVFNILISFYQIKSLFEINNRSGKGLQFIDDILNSRLIMTDNLKSFCPFRMLDAVSKEVLTGYGLPLVMTLTIQLGLVLLKSLSWLKNKALSRKVDSLAQRFYVGYFLVFIFCFKNLTRTSFKLVNCIKIENLDVLYISGDTQCFHWWQILNILFISIWVIPFPLSIALTYLMVQRQTISNTKFMICLTLPIVAPFIYLYTIRRNQKTESKESTNVTIIKERFHEIFQEPYKDNYWWWEAWRLMERLILSTVSVFIIDPFHKIFTIMILIIVLTYFHFHLKPYNPKMFILHKLDMVSFICLHFHLIYNVTLLFMTTHEQMDFHIGVLAELFSPLWYLVIFTIASKVKKKLKKK